MFFIIKGNTMRCDMISAMKKLSVVLAVVSASFAISAGATVIEFTYTGTGSGVIGTSTFQNASFVITEQSDTSNIQNCGLGCSFIDANSASIFIDGIGSFLFNTGTRTFDNNGRVGFSRSGLFGADLFDVFNVDPDWDMTSSIGPISGMANFLQWDSSPVNTNYGVLSFNDGSTSGTFQAITSISAVPEPETYAMLVAGLGLIGFMAGRRKQHLAA